ncbi:MAG: PilZ domain-containing protein [Candidatus Omnitrophica bacterium]|nr:PilZ domain-containing protein [Candidatus Omnitrophota bacterium]MDD5592616.1 PilZ domain-containing protein [Candidatus Omnitrophota bacterium]
MVKEAGYSGHERRSFIRLDYVTPLAYKVCKEETIHKLLEGYTSNVSPSGVLCTIKDKVKENDILWLSFDRDTLDICHDLESRSFIYQNGVIGKVVRVEQKGDDTYEAGIQFITREEKDSTRIYPKIYFTKGEEDEETEEGQEAGLSEGEVKEEVQEDMQDNRENEEI